MLKEIKEKDELKSVELEKLIKFIKDASENSIDDNDNDVDD